MREIRRGLLLLAAVTLLAGCRLIPERSQGERLWRARCAECHGLDGAGNTPRYMGDPNADLLDDNWSHGSGSGSWELVIRNGVFGRMPANPDLKPSEVKALIEYLKVLRRDARPLG